MQNSGASPKNQFSTTPKAHDKPIPKARQKAAIAARWLVGHEDADHQRDEHGRQRDQRPHRPQQVEHEDRLELPAHGLRFFVDAEHGDQAAKCCRAASGCREGPEQHQTKQEHSLLPQETVEAAAEDVPHRPPQQVRLKRAEQKLVTGRDLEAVEKQSERR